MRCECLCFTKLGPAQIAAWQRLRAAGVGLDSPFLHPDFFGWIAREYADFEIGLVVDAGEIRLLWPFERVGRHGRSVASDLCDLTGVIAADDLIWEPLEVLERLDCGGGTTIACRSRRGRFVPCTFVSAPIAAWTTGEPASPTKPPRRKRQGSCQGRAATLRVLRRQIILSVPATYVLRSAGTRPLVSRPGIGPLESNATFAMTRSGRWLMIEMLDRPFAGKSVLVTGHTGFKGSWLCLWLWRLGARVTGYSLAPPTIPNNFAESRIAEILAGHHTADVRDTAALCRVLEECRPDVVLHLAAQSIVRRGYREPLETFSTNIMGTASVLEAIRLSQRPCVAVLVTSDKCYDNREQVWGYRESDPMGEHDPYGGSKGAAELVIRAYRDSFFPTDRLGLHGVKLASARAGNVIGGGDWTPDALLVDAVRSLSRGEPIPIRSPGAYRPWQHVLQALSGYLTLAAKLLTSDEPGLCSGWNIGPLPGNEIPVRQVVDLFLQEWGEGRWIDASNPAAPREAGILRLSIDKALWELNWKPGWDVREAIRQTARWYRHRQASPAGQVGERDLQDFSLQQIAAYEDTMRHVMSDATCQVSAT